MLNESLLDSNNNSYFSHDTENKVLCACFDSKKVDDLICELKPEYFHSPENRMLFTAMKYLYNKNKPIDTGTVYDILNMKGKADDVGGVRKILNVFNATPTTENVGYYVESLKKYYRRRRLKEVGERYILMSKSSDDIDEAERLVMSIRDVEEDLEFSNLSDACGKVFDSFLLKKNNDEDPNKLTTFYKFFDDMTGGFFAGQMIVIAARPGIGKSTIALNICKNILEKSVDKPEKKNILFLSLEMTEEEICKKTALCIIGKSEEYLIQHSDSEKDYVDALDFVSRSDNFHIVCQGHMNTTKIKALARRIKHKYGAIHLIVIDYLQLLESNSMKNQNREREIAEISREVKVMAKEFNVPVIALSQLNRGMDSRMVKVPKLSDIRDSGAIEQDADKVFLVYNYLDAHSGQGMEENLKNVIVIDCQKNRQSKIAKQLFYFNRPASKVKEFDKKEVEAIAKLEQQDDNEND